MKSNGSIEDFLPESVSIRLAEKGDRAFLFELYAKNRKLELLDAGIEEDKILTFLMSRFSIETRRLEAEFDHATMLILADSTGPVGRLYFEILDTEIYIIDIAILSEKQGLGLGRALLTGLQAVATRESKLLIVEVNEDDSALDFFLKQGFNSVGQADLFQVLEWRKE